MVSPEKLTPALYAIHWVLVRARAMAGDQVPHQRLFKLMDWAELLPSLVARADDTNEEFRASLQGIAEEFPECRGLLANYDKGFSWFVHAQAQPDGK